MPLGQGRSSSQCLLRRWRHSLRQWPYCSASGLSSTYSASGLRVTSSSLIAVRSPACMQVHAYQKHLSVFGTAMHIHIWPLSCYKELVRCFCLQARPIVRTGSRPSPACDNSVRPGSDDGADGHGRGRFRQGNVGSVERGEGGRSAPSLFPLSPGSRTPTHARMLLPVSRC